MAKPKVEFTPDEAMLLLEWSKSGMQADLDAYDDKMVVYENLNRKQCELLWKQTIKKLKLIIKNG